ncbi:MAG TPA: NAD(P)-binding domain-containing protein [Devosia sp.]|uniref:NADPH-dependent F420 reductase n=1 Tax=Devosia sp. TaxID=1871048 RepID=UPI002DDCF889|nr:NAD(P)-binding domain-containing protein [Devosia sp.]HEV2513697.1 NAD(P)-binding domain-containing protein [Devosia sp.]
MTTTAILGLGNMGKGLAKRLAGKTELVLGASNPAAAAEFASSVGATVTDYQNAVLAADIVVLALPYGAALELAGKLPLSGKIVVDITNPLKADFSGLTIGHTTSAAEQLQAAAPSAKVVKGYNTIFASLFDTPVSATRNVPVFLAGNDVAALEAVAELVRASGFAVENVGGLDGARLIEPVGMLNIRFGYGLGQGTAIAPTWLKLAA